MFKNVVDCTALTVRDADFYFKNITGEPYQNDVSFLATARALVSPRIKEGNSVYINFISLTTMSSISSLKSNIPTGRPGYLTVIDLRCERGVCIDTIRGVDAVLADGYPGYRKIDKVTDFFQKSFAVSCYVNDDIKDTIILTEKLDMRRLHYLQCSILAALPWFFDPAVGVSEREMTLIQSLCKNDSSEYIECINEMAKQFDFRSARIREMLNGFEVRYERNEREKVINEIESLNNEIRRYNNSIGGFLSKREAFHTKLMGLDFKIWKGSSEESEITEYVLRNNKIHLVDVDDTTMIFCAKDYLSSFDKDMAERIISNKSSYVYDGPGSSNDINNMEKLMKAIFLDEILKIRFCAAYSFNMNGNVRPIGSYNFAEEGQFDDYMPNPHIDRFECMGNYTRIINEILQDRNYLMAIEQCVASCRSLNFADSTVMREFMHGMYGTNNKNNRCIELPDGRVVKPKEAAEWLNQRAAETATA